jgi:phosphomannomutase
VKILFENGRKPTIEEEFSIESGLFCGTRSARGESKIEQITNDTYIQHTTQELVDLRKRGLIPEEGFLVDGSGGWISTWLADMISKTGFPCKEVSDRNVGINWKSGAGSLNEGVVIGWEECKISEHSLLRMLEPSPRGSVLGFCFDGDGDRCLLVCSSGDGACVVGGDGFLRLFSQGCRNEEDFSAALTIESALDVGYGLRSLGIGRVTETGVGDRWLQQALIDDVDVNCLVGAEPSGHVVLRHRIGHKIGLWGDGVKTMLELLGMIGLQGDNWLDLATSSTSLKLAYSISPSDRSLWKPDGKSGQLAINSIIQSLNVNSKKVSRVEVNGEDSLLLLKHSGEGEWSFAIRNSGTESKTRVTIRTTGGSEEKVERVMAAIIDVLEPLLQPDTKS